MAKQSEVAQPGLLASLLQFGLYKPNQGRIVRQVTAVTIAVTGLLAANELSSIGLIVKWFEGSRYVFLLLFSAIGLWLAYRLVNVPKFADFMVAVEAEMKKVSWPTRKELWRASVVVIFVIFSMAAMLWVFDVAWTAIFKFIGIRYG
jgi:preprotein translocase subunit SecE